MTMVHRSGGVPFREGPLVVDFEGVALDGHAFPVAWIDAYELITFRRKSWLMTASIYGAGCLAGLCVVVAVVLLANSEEFGTAWAAQAGVGAFFFLMLTRGLLFYDHAYRRYEIWLRTRGTRRLALQTQRAKVFERAASALFQVVGGDKEETEEVVIGAQPGSPG